MGFGRLASLVSIFITKGATPMSSEKNTPTPAEDHGESPFVRDADPNILPVGFYQIPGARKYMINDKFEVREIDTRAQVKPGRFGDYWAATVINDNGLKVRRSVKKMLREAKKAAGL